MRNGLRNFQTQVKSAIHAKFPIQNSRPSACHKKATRNGACAHFGGNFEWGITRMREFSLTTDLKNPVQNSQQLLTSGVHNAKAEECILPAYSR